MNFVIPESIETPRLLLRTFREEDWRGLHELYSDAESTRYTFRRVLTEPESWRTLASLIGHWHLRGYGPYALEDKATRTVFGTAGLWYPLEWPEPEIKWALSRRFWGRGYAAEAARAIQAMALRHVPELHLISLIHSENVHSIRLAQAVGATLEKEIEFRGGRYQVYRHPHESRASV